MRKEPVQGIRRVVYEETLFASSLLMAMKRRTDEQTLPTAADRTAEMEQLLLSNVMAHSEPDQRGLAADVESGDHTLQQAQ